MNLEIPLSVATMPFLRHLYLGGNLFSDQIPPKYDTWQHLQYLALSGNKLSNNMLSGER